MTVLAGSIVGIAQGASGDTYACDSQLNVIWRIAPDGLVAPFAGTGVSRSYGDGEPAIKAGLNSPQYCTLDGSGNLVFSETGRMLLFVMPLRAAGHLIANLGRHSRAAGKPRLEREGYKPFWCIMMLWGLRKQFDRV